MPIQKPAADLQFLRDVSRLWRDGLTQTEIAQEVGLSGASALKGKLYRLGFNLVRQGGLRVVTILGGHDFDQMDADGEIVSAEVLEPVPA